MPVWNYPVELTNSIAKKLTVFPWKNTAPSIRFLSFMILPKRELHPERMRQLISVSISPLGNFWLQWTKPFKSNKKGCSLTAPTEIYRILFAQRHFPVECLFSLVGLGNCMNHKASTYLCEWSVLVFYKNGMWNTTLYLDYQTSHILKTFNEDDSKCDSSTTAVFDFALIYLLWRTDILFFRHICIPQRKSIQVERKLNARKKIIRCDKCTCEWSECACWKRRISGKTENKGKVFRSEKFLVDNIGANQHVIELLLEKLEIISSNAICLSLGK